MRVLVLAEKRADAKNVVAAFKLKGINAKYIRLSKVMLVSRNSKTLIRIVNDDLDNFDAVCLIASPSVAPFVEPLLEELENKKIFVNVRPGSFYLGQNIPLLFVTLSMSSIKSPKTLVSGSGKNIERVSKKISYPLVAKSFVGKDVQQSLLVRDVRELNAFVNSIKQDVDGFMLREFIEGDVISCAVVGTHIFAIKRKMGNDIPIALEKGTTYKLTDSERETVLETSRVIGYDIAEIELVKGKVISVEPKISFKQFNSICSENVESFVADYYLEKEEFIEPKSILGELKGIKSIFSKTILERLFK